MGVHVNVDKCIGCQQCVKDCFPDDIEMRDGKAFIRNKTCIKCTHCIAVCPTNAITIDEYNMDEVEEYNKETFDISPENLMNFIKFRRTVRHFKPAKVEAEKIKQIIDTGRFTQTGRNLQDTEYIVIQDKIPELRELAYEGIENLVKYVETNKETINPAYLKYTKFWTNMCNAFKADPIKGDKLFFNAPLIVLVVGEVEINSGLASSNMELMVNALGLGTFFSGFFTRAFDHNPKMAELLQIPEGKKIMSCMVIGYPDVKYRRTAPRADGKVKYL